jgi:hypothetical protein
MGLNGTIQRELTVTIPLDKIWKKLYVAARLRWIHLRTDYRLLRYRDEDTGWNPYGREIAAEANEEIVDLLGIRKLDFRTFSQLLCQHPDTDETKTKCRTCGVTLQQLVASE